jgi:sigma-E factor negative regulatory protein RseB
MQIRFLWWLPLVASAAWWTPALAGPHDASNALPTLDARAWLDRIRHAAKQRNYQGTMVFTASEVVSSSRVAHYCVGDDIYERVEALDGRQRNIYRHNDVVHTVWPASKVATVERVDSAAESLGMPELEARLQEQYDVRMLGTDRLAGRQAHVLMLQPRDTARFAQRLWADADTGLMLRADVLNVQGAVLESSAFSYIEIGGRSMHASVMAPARMLEGYRVVDLQAEPTRLEVEGWSLKALPPGFRVVGCTRRAIGDPAAVAGAATPRALQVLLSDGLARVSIFIEPHDPDRPRQALLTQMGATHTLMKQRFERWWVTVMGDVPPATLKQFFMALERQP